MVGSQAEADGGPAAVGGVGSGDASTAGGADAAVGGEPGKTSLRAVPSALLHGQPTEWRAA